MHIFNIFFKIQVDELTQKTDKKSWNFSHLLNMSTENINTFMDDYFFNSFYQKNWISKTKLDLLLF